MATARKGREKFMFFSAMAPRGKGMENWVFLHVAETCPQGYFLASVATLAQWLESS